MHYTIYQITNRVNNKIYIGCHKTDDLDDGYMGSGKILSRAIEKYGVENFTKEYLMICNTAKEMFGIEAELVNEEFVTRVDTYNLKKGGLGGFDHINKHGAAANQAGRDVIHRKWAAGNLPRDYMLGKQHTVETKQRIGEASRQRLKDGHPEETIKKISASLKELMWITNEVTNRKIRKTEPLPSGWRKGRKKKQL